MISRNSSIAKMTKWDNFRERKDLLIDSVIQVKKKQKSITTFVIHTVISLLLNKMTQNI